MEILSNIIDSSINNNSYISKIMLFGSILIPSKQFLARFKFRPWKGVYCCSEFLESVDFANNIVTKILKTYNKYEICPIIETNISSEGHLRRLEKFFISN